MQCGFSSVSRVAPAATAAVWAHPCCSSGRHLPWLPSPAFSVLHAGSRRWQQQPLPRGSSRAARPRCASLPNHYEVLGVEQASDYDVIKAAFRRAAKALHPDVNPDPSAQQSFVQLRMAYQVLSDPSQRAQYDSQLNRVRAARAAAAARQQAHGSSHGRSSVRMGWTDSGWAVGVEFGDGGDDEDGEEDVDWWGDDDWEDEGEEDVLDVFNWGPSVRGKGPSRTWRPSAEDPWSQGALRRERAQAQARQEAERMARQAAAAAAQAQAYAYAAASAAGRQAGQRSTRSGSAPWSFTPEDILRSLSPEAQITAQNVFGSRLERLKSMEQLSEFADVLQVLRSDMGMQFDIFADVPETRRRRTRARTSDIPSTRSSASPAVHPKPSSTPNSNSKSATRMPSNDTGERGVRAAMGARGTPAAQAASKQNAVGEAGPALSAVGARSRVPGMPGAGSGSSGSAGASRARQAEERQPTVLSRSAPLPWQQHRLQQQQQASLAEQAEVKVGSSAVRRPWQQQQQPQQREEPEEQASASTNGTGAPGRWQQQRQPQRQAQEEQTAPQSQGSGSPKPWERQRQRQQPEEEAPLQARTTTIPGRWQQQQQQQQHGASGDVLAVSEDAKMASGVRKPWSPAPSPARNVPEPPKRSPPPAQPRGVPSRAWPGQAATSSSSEDLDDVLL